MLVANYCTFMGTFKNLQLILTGMIKVQVKMLDIFVTKKYRLFFQKLCKLLMI